MTTKRRGMTEEAADAAIDQACRMLRMPTIRNSFTDYADRASREQMSYRGFLAELLLAECDDRARRRSERRIKAAKFPREKSLRAFDFDANPNVDPAVIHTLAKCEWVQKGQPLCLIGDSGTGKSHLLIALGTEAAMAGHRVKYTLATKLANELVEAADEMTLAKTIARYGRVDLLCIDELGYMQLDRRGAELLFQVLTEREEKASVAIASNESFGGSPSMAPSSRPAQTPTAWPKPQSSRRPDCCPGAGSGVDADLHHQHESGPSGVRTHRQAGVGRNRRSHKDDSEMTPLTAALGPAHSRYFGAGYKRVRYEVGCIQEKPVPGHCVHADVTAIYPSDWSMSAAGAPRSPHLSSVDAVVLPLIVLENLFGPETLARYWVSRAELRAPAKPFTNLDHIPLKLGIQGVPGSAELALDCVVGGMRTRLTLSSPEGIPSSASALQQEATVYSEGFRHVHPETYLRETSDMDRLDASHRFTSESMPNTTGIEAAFSPAISVVDLLVTMGQVTQAAIYRRVDESARRGELWLRSMTIDLDNSPRALPCALRSRTRVVRDQLLVRGERRTHSLRTESMIEEAARIRADLAYVEPGFTPNQGAEV